MTRITVLHVVSLAAAVVTGRPALFAQEVAPNVSFEEGTDGPRGWSDRGGGRWGKGQAREGERFLSASRRNAGVAWESDAIEVRPDTDYRFEGWLRCESG